MFYNLGPDLVGVQASLSLQWAHRLLVDNDIVMH